MVRIIIKNTHMKKIAAIILATLLLFACKNTQPLAVKAFMIDQAKYDLVGYYFEMKDGGVGWVTNFNKIERLAVYAGGITKIEQLGVLKSISNSKTDLTTAINYLGEKQYSVQ